MPKRVEELFFFISHNSKDKASPAFVDVVNRLHAAGIPLGIDYPHDIPAHAKIKPQDFVWRMEGRNEDWEHQVTLALGEGACGIIVLTSSNTGSSSFVWPEVRIAQTLRTLLKPDYGFHFLALEPGAEAFVPPPYDRTPLIRTGPELDHEIGRMKAHLERERRRRANRDPEQRLAEAAMKAMIRQMASLDLIGGPPVSLDAVFTPLRGDALSGGERAAAHAAFLDATDDLNDLPGSTRRDDRDTRLSAARLARLRQEPIMAGMQQGLLAAQDPWAIAGETVTLSDVVERNGRTVILGEPAAGKTTLLKWLGLRFAQVWAALDGSDPSDVTVRALRYHVDPAARFADDEERQDRPVHVSLGLARLPVFLSAQDMSNWVRKHGVGDLIGHLAISLASRAGAGLFREPEKIARKAILAQLKEGRLLVLLDGLDEIDETLRSPILGIVEDFAQTWTSSDSTNEPGRNNRIVVTSRVVGYHTLPLSANWPHVVVDRMTPAVALEFWERLYRSEAFAIEGDPKVKAAALHQSVYARGRTGLADLAGIPLLAALLAIVFQRDQQLPRHRAQIYERVFATIAQKRPSDLRSDYVARWLAPLAYKLHGGHGSSLIEVDQLRDDLCERLKAIEPEIRGNQRRTEMVAGFLKENRENLGLLVERAENLWAFVHRTFQEYLAGRWLAESRSDRIDWAALLADGRWREPLLLLLGSSIFAGEINAAARDGIFRELLAAADGLAEQARVGRFLAEALQEMPDLPSLEVLCEIVRAALADVAGEDWETLPAFVRIRAIAALYAIGRGDVEQLEAVLCALLREGPGEISRLVSRIILDRHWCSIPLEAALRAAEPHDRTAEDLPILRALQQVMSEIRHGELGAGGKAAAVERQLDREKKALPRAVRLSARPTPKETIYDVLRTRAQRGRYAALGRLDLQEDEVDGFLKRASASRSPETSLSPPAQARIDPRTREGLQSTVALALGRGFEYRGRVAALTAFGELLRFIGMNDTARQAALEYRPDLRMRFGIEDPVLHIADNLDLFLQPTFTDFAPPYAADGEIVFPTALSPSVASRLPMEETSPNWLEAIRHRLTPGRFKRPEHRAQDILVAALEDTTGAVPVGRWLTDLTNDQRTALDDLLRRTLLVARDSILHAGFYLAATLHRAAPDGEQAFLQALDTTAKVFPMTPLRVSVEVHSASPRLFAERLAYHLVVLDAADARYAAAVALDAQDGLPIQTLLETLQALSETVTAAWAQTALGIDVGAPFPIDRETHEITLAVLDAASRINAGDDMSLRSAQASMLFKRLFQAPGLQYAASLTPFAGLPRGVLSWGISIEEAAEALREVGDPYHDARFALGLYEASLSDTGAQEAEGLLVRIANPVLRLDIAERLATLLPGADAARIRVLAAQAARAISAPTERWRALTRLALQPGYPRSRLLKEAVAAIDMIANPVIRRRDAGVAFRLFGRDRSSNPADAPRPADLRNGRLAPSLLALPPDSGDAMAILYIAQTCLDLLTGMEQTAPKTHPRASKAGADPLWGPGLPVVDLTVELADRLAVLARDEDPASTAELPSIGWARQVRIACGFSLFACERWLDRPDHPLAWIAALAIIKARSRRDRRVLEPLLHAARGNDEAFAANAVWMLTRGRLLVQRQSPDTAFQDMGFETLLWIGRLAVDPAQGDLRRILGCLIMDVEVPDAGLISLLMDHLERSPEDRAAVEFIVEYLTWTGEAATTAILDSMAAQDSELQARMILSLAAIDRTQRVEKARKAEPGAPVPPPEIESRPIPEATIAETLRALGPTNDTAPFRIFEQGGKDLCASIERVCLTTEPAQRLTSFYADLETARIDIRQPLSTPETAYAALESFLGSKTHTAGQAVPFRHDRLACHALSRHAGADAVHLAVEILIDLTRTERVDIELAGLIATTCIEFALDNPSLVISAFKARLEGDKGMMAFLAALMRNPPRGVSTATATALTCLLRPLDSGCVDALVAISQRPDVGDWVLLEQSLLGVGRLEESALPITAAALAHERPRTNLLAIRLLGALARDAGATTETRRAAREVLEHFTQDDRAAGEIHLFAPATMNTTEGQVLNCGSLANIARTELFLIDSARP